MTTQEQLIQLHSLFLQEKALKQQIQALNQQRDNLAKALYQSLPQEEWVWVCDDAIAYTKHSDYLSGDNVDRDSITFSELMRITDQLRAAA